MLDDPGKLNQLNLNKFGDPECYIYCAIRDVFRTQTKVPELLDTSKEPERVTKLTAGCCQARDVHGELLIGAAFCERGVRFVQPSSRLGAEPAHRFAEDDACHRPTDHGVAQ